MLLKSLFTFLICCFAVATSATDQTLDIIYVEGKEYQLPDINNSKMFMNVFANGALIKEKEDSFRFTTASKKDYQGERKALIQLFTFDLEEVDAPKREPDRLLLEDGFPEELSKKLPMKYQDFFSLYHVYKNPRIGASTALWRGYRAQWAIKSGKLYLTARLFAGDYYVREFKGRIKDTELHHDDAAIYPPEPIFADWYTSKLFLQTDFQSKKISSGKTIRKTIYDIYNIRNGRILDIKKCVVEQKDYEFFDHKKYCLT